MRTLQDPRLDKWDARPQPPPPRRWRRGRGQGLLLMLVGVAIPLIVFFLQTDGALRFFEADKFLERTMTPQEKQEIRAAIASHMKKLDTVQRIVEKIKEAYRDKTGASYQRDMWVVHVKQGFAIPFMYVLGLGVIIHLIGIGKLFL